MDFYPLGTHVSVAACSIPLKRELPHAFVSMSLLTHHRSAMPFGNRKNYFRGSFQFNIVTIKKKYYSSEDLKFNNLGIFKSLKSRILLGKILLMSLTS